MGSEKLRENWEIWGIALVVSGAVLAGLVFRGVTGDTLSDAVKDIGAALIPIVTAFLAARLVIREMDQSQRFQQAGEEALSRIQAAHSDWLQGPKYDKLNLDENKPGKAGRYLFVQKSTGSRRGQFVPVAHLRYGVVQIRVNRTAVILLGLAEQKDTASLEKQQKRLQQEIAKAVEAVVDRRWKQFLEPPAKDKDNESDSSASESEESEPKRVKHADIAIEVDFDERKLGPRKFRKAVQECVEAACRVIEAAKKR